MNNANSHQHQQHQQQIFQTPLSYNAPDLSLVSMFSCFGIGPSGMMVVVPPEITLNSNAIGYIKICYSIPSAIQKSYHPKPGVLHNGIARKAYLPYTTEGHELLIRLQYGFLHGLNFSVGRSLASGRDDQVTWSHSVPHKTSKTGGTSLFGFPDANYLPTLRLALDQLRVPSDTNTCHQWIIQNQPSIAVSAKTLPAAPTMIAPVALLGSGATSFMTTTAANISTQNEHIDYQAPSQGNTIDQLSQYLEPVVFDIKNNKPNESSIGNNATVNNWNNQAGKENDWDECPICLDVLHQTPRAATSTVVRLKKCRHCFHKDCIVKMFQSQHNKCPTCRELIDDDGFGQGPSGSMTITLISGTICPGFEYDCNGVIEIYYGMPSGIQTSYMENPGQNYSGTSRKAYLPHNDSGRKLLARLKFAFTHGLVFRIGTSLTTGITNQITWTSIHHKTSLYAGAHGYPDDQYLTNCNDALDALRVPK